MAERFLMHRGVLPRMRMLACGVVVRKDAMKLATDRGWWTKPYAHALWAPLGTYVDYVEAAHLGGNVAWDDEVAAADPAALSRAMVLVQRDIDEISRLQKTDCAPYLIPIRRGVMPVPNVTCIARIAAEKTMPDKLPIPTLSVPWWAWLALGYLITRGRK